MTSERFVLTTINGHEVKEDGHHALPEFIVTYNNSNEIPKKVDTEDIYLMIKDKDISWIDDLANDPDLITKKYKARHKN